ncbi:MAG: beta-lactamase family protein, partial [Gemmatimonadetes bacterium]|nr:beta-lactamase family protein [Gemmatimonadota bacterium]
MPPATPTLDAAETRLVARVEAALDSLDALRPFSGIVVVRHRARTLLVRTRGVANRQTGAAIDLGTAFNLGSSNKLFTAIAVRRLVAEGRLAADAPIARYWPDYPDPPFARVATVEQLLAHRSGIGGDIFGRPPGGRLSLRRNDDFVPLFAGVAPEFAAGTQQAYSNPGFVVLGGLIERVAGVSYYRY